MLHVALTHPKLGSSCPRCLGTSRRGTISCSWTSHIFFWGRSNGCIIFTRKMPSTADFQRRLKVWILMQADSFAHSHLETGPLIFIYYSPWQHVQSVCRFPSSFNFQWAGRLQLVVLSSVWIKGKHWTRSLWACSCSGKMQIHYTRVGYEKKLRPNWIRLLVIFLLWGTSRLLLLFQTFSPSQPRRGNHRMGQSCILKNWQGQVS